MKGICILSGGLDSTTLLYRMRSEGIDTKAISFNYGQRHVRELDMAKATCKRLGIEHRVVDLSGLKGLLNSALTRDIPIPLGHYEQENMKQTVVPNRNMIMLSIAGAWAFSEEAEVVGIGVHAGDHAIYPDCRKDFIMMCRETMNLGNLWHKPLTVYTPYILASKGEIIKDGIRLGVDYGLTWTCYQGKDKPCGKCGSCTERAEAFKLNHISDPLT